MCSCVELMSYTLREYFHQVYGHYNHNNTTRFHFCPFPVHVREDHVDFRILKLLFNSKSVLGWLHSVYFFIRTYLTLIDD